MTELIFTIHFPHFEDEPKTIQLKAGLHVIYGDSGVGKSAFCKMLAQLNQNNVNTNFRISVISSYEDVGMVLQDPDDQIVAPTLFRELAFNFENLGMESKEINQAISRTVDRSDLQFDLNRHPANLSGGEKELVNLATALSTNPKLLIIDDGFAFLSRRRKNELIKQVKEYADNQEAIIVWTTATQEDLSCGHTKWELKLDEFEKSYLKETATISAEIQNGMMFLQCENLTFGYEEKNLLFSQLTCSYGPFRSFALVGENGSGKTTLCRLLSNVLKPSSGSVKLLLGDRKELRIGYLPQFPERMFGGFSLSELMMRMRKNHLLSESAELFLKSSLKQFTVSWDLIKDNPINNLKLSVTRICLILMLLHARYDILILDEPMFSLGHSQRMKVMEQLRDSMSRKHFVIISHSDYLVRSICDAALVIENGKLLLLQEDVIHA